MDMLSVSVQDSCESLISYLTNLANKKGAKEGHWANILQGPVSRKTRELFGPEKLVFKPETAWLEKLIFQDDFNVRKTKRIVKFGGLEPRCYEDVKEIVAPEIDPKSFGTFEKQAPGPSRLKPD